MEKTQLARWGRRVSACARSISSVLDIPSIYVSMATPAPLVSGVSAGLRALKRKGKLAKDEKITVFAVAGDGGTADIGFGALSGAAERNDDGVYFCYDNEAYMNTGIQRSSQTPQKSWTTSTLEGKPQPKKNLPKIMADHNLPYVATASVGFPDDPDHEGEKGQGYNWRISIYSYPGPMCPGMALSAENKVIEIARLAVDCGMWLLYEVKDGDLKLTYKPIRNASR